MPSLGEFGQALGLGLLASGSPGSQAVFRDLVANRQQQQNDQKALEINAAKTGFDATSQWLADPGNQNSPERPAVEKLRINYGTRIGFQPEEIPPVLPAQLAGDQFTLRPGEKRFNASGGVIAEIAPKPESPADRVAGAVPAGSCGSHRDQVAC